MRRPSITLTGDAWEVLSRLVAMIDTCPTCNGSGQRFTHGDDACHHCGGEGVVIVGSISANEVQEAFDKLHKYNQAMFKFMGKEKS